MDTACHLDELKPCKASSLTKELTNASHMQFAKPDMKATKKLKADGVVPPRTIGHPAGLKPGDTVEGRGELDALAVHNMAVQGIDSKAGYPAFAICMSGGYVDDDDAGKVISYTGMGGQTGKHQTADQKLTMVRAAVNGLSG